LCESTLAQGAPMPPPITPPHAPSPPPATPPAQQGTLYLPWVWAPPVVVVIEHDDQQ
jgi:hypothetical protein